MTTFDETTEMCPMGSERGATGGLERRREGRRLGTGYQNALGLRLDIVAMVMFMTATTAS
jgi:hypothetical protein